MTSASIRPAAAELSSESLEDAAAWELMKKQVDCEIDRPACIHENFFTDDDGVLFHEISCFTV